MINNVEQAFRNNDEGRYYSKHFPKILTGWESVYTTGRHVIESEGRHES